MSQVTTTSKMDQCTQIRSEDRAPVLLLDMASFFVVGLTRSAGQISTVHGNMTLDAHVWNC